MEQIIYKKVDKQLIFLSLFITIKWIGTIVAIGDYTIGTICFFSLSLIIMIIPLIMKLHNKQLLDYKYGRKICMWNSFILFLLNVLLVIINIVPLLFFNLFSVIAYYFLNKYLFMQNKNNIYNEKQEQTSNKTNNMSNYDSLLKLKELLDKQIITSEEFEEEKRKILGK